MANLRDLKKDINFVLGDIIDATYMHEAINPETAGEKTEAIIDEAISTFDVLMAKVSDRKVENRKAHLKGVRVELQTKAASLVEKINAL